MNYITGFIGRSLIGLLVFSQVSPVMLVCLAKCIPVREKTTEIANVARVVEVVVVCTAG